MSRSTRMLLGLGALAALLIACALLIAGAAPSNGATQAIIASANETSLTPGPGVTLLAPPGVTLVFSPTPSLTPSDTLSPTPTVPSPTPSITPSVTPTFGPSPTLTPFPPDHPPEDHFWMSRPIPAGYVNYVDQNYIYGATQSGKRQPHHGVDMQSPAGTPVIAAAAGTVIFAGPDWEEQLGPSLAFYGNTVVIQHDQTYRDQPVYTLYGHLSTIAVAKGQVVQAGDAVGQVGGTGVALGPHLHFEVRVGRNDYISTRNPELWIVPFPRWGVLAGRVLSPEGDPVYSVTVDVRSVKLVDDTIDPIIRFVTTYAPETLNADDEFKENFVMGDLPAGTYSVAVSGLSEKQTITVAPDSSAWVVLVTK